MARSDNSDRLDNNSNTINRVRSCCYFFFLSHFFQFFSLLGNDSRRHAHYIILSYRIYRHKTLYSYIYLHVPNFYLYHTSYRHTSVVYYYTYFAFLPTVTTTTSGVVNINNLKGLNGFTCPNPVGLGTKRFAMPVVKTSLTTSLVASHQLPSKRFFPIFLSLLLFSILYSVEFVDESCDDDALPLP